MFGFMKKSDKEKEEKERKKREKKEKKELKKVAKERPLTQDELYRLEEAKRGLFRRPSDNNTGAVAYRDPTHSGDGVHDPPGASDSSESSNVSTPREDHPEPGTQNQQVRGRQMELTKPHKPHRHPRSSSKGILKGKSSYGPDIPNQGVTGNVDDTEVLEGNTLLNEMMSGRLPTPPDGIDGKVVKEQPSGRHSSEKRTPPKIAPKPSPRPSGGPPPLPTSAPPSGQPGLAVMSPEHLLSPTEKTFGGVELQLPNVAPPRAVRPREIILRRQPAGDFGFTLRRGTILERGSNDNAERKRIVIFAEPGPKNMHTGLLPGDRLIEVNGENVENSSREEIIELIKKSGQEVILKVQPIPELSELSMRSGTEGEELPIQEQNVKTATLQRTGSMRYKKRQTKTEDQVASEKAWLSTEKVWLIHKAGFTSAHLLQPTGVADPLPEGKVKVKLEYNEQIMEVDEEDVEKANPPQFDRIEDVASLRFLNESSVLHTLRQRYGSNLIHSYAGPSLVITNPMHQLSIYSEKVIQMFRGCRPEDMPPHVYATAQISYRNMLATRMDQSIIMMGRSGSGKTSNARHMLHYLTVAAGTVNHTLSADKLNSVFTLLDAFGNSRTIMNTSATKFSSLISLDFDHAGQIAAANVQVLMLDRLRIVKRPEGEPTFHVFYQMLAGLDAQLRNELQLQNLNEPNIFMTPLQRAEDRQRATSAWGKIIHSFNSLGFSDSEVRAVCSVLAVIYHLGVACVVKGANNKFQFGRPAAAQKAASILGTTAEELSRTLFAPTPQIIRGSPARSPGDKSASAETNGMEALEGFVIGLYSELFNAVISLVNRGISSNHRALSSLHIFDSPGFQNPSTCGRNAGASFEDLCHNYAQERLQLLFHETVFTTQQDLYSQENIQCDFEMVTSSPQPIVALIDKPPQQGIVRTSHDVKDADQRGLLWLLDEEAIFPGATDDSFTDRVMMHHGHGSERRNLIRKGSHKHQILINHFQGTNPVVYNTKGWLKACRESPVSRTATGFLQDSHKDFISELFSTVRGPLSTTVSGSTLNVEGGSSLRRASSMRRTHQSAMASLKRKSVCMQAKFQVDAAIDSMRRTKMHFVQCLLPQHNAGLCDLRQSMHAPNKTSASEDIMLNVPLVRQQIRGMELIDAIRIHRQGFPEHMLFSEFRRRFELLHSPQGQDGKTSAMLDDKQAVELLLRGLEIDKSTYRLGLSQVFFRAGGLSQLEDIRDEKLTGTIVSLQAYCRGYLVRRNLQKLKLQHLAVTCIQRNVKKFMAIRNWSWWRLYTKLQPLLDVHRTEEELRNKDEELELLKSKVERLERERNDFKHSVDKLETKLSGMQADYVDEHTTSTHATEMLESETAQRLKLEREMKDIQSKYNALQRRHEQTEMDLMQARLVATAIENEFDEDDLDGDSIYRQKYEKLKREMEFMKKKLEQQHEEEMEKKDAMKKQLERKLSEMTSENDEQKRHVNNLKRKSQRLNADMQDMKLHLEDQVSRNSDLEKKQRKFDTEVQKVNTVLLQEKNVLNQTQKERDEIISERFSLEQELKNVKLEYELQTEKLQRLEKELQEISSAGNKDDKEVISLKRLKTDLEAKLQEQEDELDEQAGVIQQLEQTKLRLEMNKEKLRQEHNRELEEKEQEMEDMRTSSQKKVKAIEAQLEEEYAEKQSLAKEKREMERKLKELTELEPEVNRDAEHRLRRNLKRTKALWRDAQMMLEKQKEGSGGRAIIKQLRNQLEDAEFATAAAVKARKGFEMEVTELQQQMDDISKSKQEVEDRYMALSREKNELQSQLDDHEEEYAELMKKYKAANGKHTVDQITIQEQSNQIEELQLEKEQLKEQLASLQSQVEFMQTSMVDKQLVVRLESKIRDLESKLELEQATRHRAELTVSRLREQLEKLTEEKDKLQASEQRNSEANKRISRQLRDNKDELADVQRHESEATQRKHDLEKKVESLEADFEQSQSDLRLAFKRIADLQAVMEDDMDSDLDSEFDSDGEFGGETGSDSSFEMSPYLVNHKSSSRRGTGGVREAGDGDTGQQQTNSTSNGHDSSLTHASAGDAGVKVAES